MDIKTGNPLEQATHYIKDLSWLWGIKDVIVLAEQNFDYLPLEEIEKRIDNAINKGLEMSKTF